jgi:hypothetical protein
VHRVVFASVLCLAGCNSLVGTDGFTLATCFGELSPVCLPSAPTGDVTLMSMSMGFPPAPDLDTGKDMRCIVVQQPDGPELCVIAGATITVPGMLHPTGKRPLVLIGTESVTIGGTLDVSTTTSGIGGGGPGPGANDPACASGLDGVSGTNDGGGGAGGSFGDQGGAGGASFGASAGGMPGAALAKPIWLRGGCAGGRGAKRTQGSTSAPGGSGGGAVAVISGRLITVSGAIYAAGLGGDGGASPYGGGGGGGTGGMILLDAPTLMVGGVLAANGGGGGGGGDQSDGNYGQDGPKSKYTDAAVGGPAVGAGHGGAGGTGGSIGKPATAGMTPTTSGGGGGGGGGAGVIWVHGALTGSKISPAPITD